MVIKLLCIAALVALVLLAILICKTVNQLIEIDQMLNDYEDNDQHHNHHHNNNY